jgi:DNA-directed RNA polymerase specialized sigma24 family protein
VCDAASVDDPKARLARIYNEMWDDLIRYVSHNAPPSMVEDIVQDTFEALCRRPEAIPLAHDECRAWVYGVARLTKTKSLREAGRRARQEHASAGMERPRMDDLLADLVGDETARGMLDVLTTPQREAVIRHIIVGMKLEEAAAESGSSLWAEAAVLSRAYKRLRAHVGTDGHETEDTEGLEHE